MRFVLKILVSHVNVTMATVTVNVNVTTFRVITIWSQVENRLNERGFSILCMPHESCRVVIIISLQTQYYTAHLFGWSRSANFREHTMHAFCCFCTSVINQTERTEINYVQRVLQQNNIKKAN